MKIALSDNGIVLGIYSGDAMLYSIVIDKPVVITNIHPEEGGYIFKYGKLFIFKTDKKIYVSGYMVKHIDKVSRKSKFNRIEIWSIDKKEFSVFPNALTLGKAIGKNRAPTIAFINRYSDACKVFSFNGVLSVMCITATVDDVLPHIDADTYIDNVTRVYRYEYNLITPKGKKVEGVCGTVRELAEISGYSISWLYYVINNNVKIDGIKIVRKHNG